MVFEFWVAVACSCRLLVRFRCCEDAYDSELDLSFDKRLVAAGSHSFPDFQQREKPTPHQTKTTFSGHASVGAVTATGSHMPTGGYIVKVVMEDIDPVNGSVLGGTIAMVEIEDVDTNFNNVAVTTTKFSSTAMASPTTTAQISTTKPLQITQRVGRHEHFKNIIVSQPSADIEQRRKLTEPEKAQCYETIAECNYSTANHKSSANVMVSHVQHINVIREQESPVHHEAVADCRDLNMTILPQTGMDATAVQVFMRKLRRNVLLRKRATQPRTNTSLENALKVLHCVDLDDMAAASDTIQKLTKDSRECCARCVEVPASQLIYNVLVRMSCQSSDPVALRNLLLSLGNLASYRHWKQQTQQPATRFEWSRSRRQLDSRLIEMLGEMLLVLSDDLKPHQQRSWSLFTAAAGALWDLVMLVRDSRSNTLFADESWIATRQRLIDLRDRLLANKLKLPVATMAMKNHTDQGDLLAEYLMNIAAVLAQILSLMSAPFQYHF